jgi:hypothetical protein
MKPNKTPLLNRTAMRDKALAVLAATRPHLAAKLTRVSGQFYERAQAAVTVWLENHIEKMPSVGKTIK